MKHFHRRSTEKFGFFKGASENGSANRLASASLNMTLPARRSLASSKVGHQQAGKQTLEDLR